MLSNEKVNFTDRETIEKGSRALIKELGYSGYLRFIRQIENSGDEYIKLQDEMYKDVTLDELFNEAKSNWNKGKK